MSASRGAADVGRCRQGNVESLRARTAAEQGHGARLCNSQVEGWQSVCHQDEAAPLQARPVVGACCGLEAKRREGRSGGRSVHPWEVTSRRLYRLCPGGSRPCLSPELVVAHARREDRGPEDRQDVCPLACRPQTESQLRGWPVQVLSSKVVFACSVVQQPDRLP